MADVLQSLLSALNADESLNATNAEGVESAEEGQASSSDTASGGFGGFDFGSFFENIDIDMLFKVGEIFSRFNHPDKNTELLRALKPHMREENKEKIDTAIKIIKVTSLLPFLRESGLFDKMF
jgi:hypothetical protein